MKNILLDTNDSHRGRTKSTSKFQPKSNGVSKCGFLPTGEFQVDNHLISEYKSIKEEEELLVVPAPRVVICLCVCLDIYTQRNNIRGVWETDAEERPFDWE